jgi:ribonuclease Z
MKRLFIGSLALVLIAGAGACINRQIIAMRLVERVIESNLSSSQLDDFEDGLHVVLCGAGSPLPDPDRSGPCVAIVAGELLYIVDAGSGASRSLSSMRIPQGRIEGVLLTHFHSDHIDGLGELMMQRWVNGSHTAPTPVHGPEGVAEVVEGLNRAYAQDARYRTAHHGAKVVPPAGSGGVARAFATPANGGEALIVDAGGLRITAFRVDHAPVSPAVGYRFDYAGRSILVSGDTRKSANLERFARGVDVLVHEALSPALVALIRNGAANAGKSNIEKIAGDIPDYHTSPVEAAEIARDAKVGRLLFYHVVPPLPLSPLETIFLGGVGDVYDGPVTLGTDGSFVSLPANSKKVVTGNLL